MPENIDLYRIERAVSKRAYLLSKFILLHVVRMVGIITGRGLPS